MSASVGSRPKPPCTEAFLRGSAGRHRRHFRGTAPLAAELHPWLRAVTKDLAGGLYPARVIKRTGQSHRDIRHDLRLVDERRSACRAEASVSRFAAVTPASECFQRALYRKCRRWQRHDDRKGAPSALLAILAVTYADKSWFYVGRIAYFAAQAATLDLHFTPPAPRRPCLP